MGYFFQMRAVGAVYLRYSIRGLSSYGMQTMLVKAFTACHADDRVE